MENEYGLLEVDVGPNGEIDEKTAKFIIEKCQEAIDEDIWYTQDEISEMLEKLEEENNKCIGSYILKDQK